MKTDINNEAEGFMGNFLTFMAESDYWDLCAAREILPEHELLIYVVDRAVLDAQNIGVQKNEPKWKWDALHWLFIGDDERDEFSLAWICEFLGLNGIHLLYKIREKVLEKIAA